MDGDGMEETQAFSLFSAGSGAEAVKKAGEPPYDEFDGVTVPSTDLQRYIVSGADTVKVVDINGEEIFSETLYSPTYGALYLQHSILGDYYFSISAYGMSRCPIPDGFCQIDTHGANNSTSVEYAVDENGNRLSNEAYRIREGALLHLTEITEGWQETEVFNGSSTPGLPNFESLFAYDALSPDSGIGVTAEGKVYFIDLTAGAATEVAADVGTGLRDVACDQMADGAYGCAIQSYADATVTPCSGSSSVDFSCGEAVSAGDGVSLGVATTVDNTLAVVSGNLTNSSIYLFEFDFSGGAFCQTLNVEWTPTQYLSLFAETGLDLSGIWHVALDADNDRGIVSGFDSGTVGIISLDEAGSQLGQNGYTFWFN